MRLLVLSFLLGAVCLELGGCVGGLFGDPGYAKNANYRGCVQFNGADRCPTPAPPPESDATSLDGVPAVIPAPAAASGTGPAPKAASSPLPTLVRKGPQ